MKLNFSRETILIILVCIGLIFVILIFLQILKLLKEFWKNKNKNFFGYKAKVIYDDSKPEAKLLVYEDDKIKLVGRPDFVLQLKNKDYIIVDAKSGRLEGLSLNSSKLQSYIQQIINYFFIVEYSLKIKPKYGELYFLEDNQRFTINNTEEFRKIALKNLYMIAEAKKQGIKPEDKSWVKCELCPYKEKCNKRIIKK